MPPRSPAAAALKAMREQSKLSVRALAEELGIAASTYASKEDKFKREFLPVEFVRKLVPIFQRCGIPRPDILRLAGIFDDEDSAVSTPPQVPAYNIGSDVKMAAIAELDVRGSMGGGSIMEDDTGRVVHEWRLPADLIRSATYAPPGRIKIITVIGDSMEGTFRPYERVMVDTDDTSPTPPGVFVVYDGLGLVVKRVEFVPHSDPPVVRITSDNPRYSPYERSLSEAYIQGRVLGRWQWV